MGLSDLRWDHDRIYIHQIKHYHHPHTTTRNKTRPKIMEFHLLKIAEASESIRTLEFRRPSIFTNAVILKPEITSLIHDADPQDHSLFRTSKNASSADKHLSPYKPQKTASSNFDESELREWNVDVFCTAVERLVSMYPVPGVESKIASYRQRWHGLNKEILYYEDIVEEQRQQLSQLNISIENRDFEDSNNTHNNNNYENDPEKLAQVIQDTELEISKLEQEVERKQSEVDQLEGRVNR